MQPTIAIIGGGNLGASLAEGLLAGNFVDPGNLYVTRRNLQSLIPLQQKGVHITDQNVQAIHNAQYIVLAVKPFQLKEVLAELQPALQANKHVLISLVTGVWIDEIREMVGNQLPVFRAMPNTAIAIRESMTCICSS
ncbi:MAG: pyrroline-5-carboxylate reductase, partial [Sediminibacterium sp.]|nr:pyrroline-5-carboxylate reductase [Sediminibacterium sp.]